MNVREPLSRFFGLSYLCGKGVLLVLFNARPTPKSMALFLHWAMSGICILIDQGMFLGYIHTVHTVYPVLTRMVFFWVVCMVVHGMYGRRELRFCFLSARIASYRTSSMQAIIR